MKGFIKTTWVFQICLLILILLNGCSNIKNTKQPDFKEEIHSLINNYHNAIVSQNYTAIYNEVISSLDRKHKPLSEFLNEQFQAYSDFNGILLKMEKESTFEVVNISTENRYVVVNYVKPNLSLVPQPDFRNLDIDNYRQIYMSNVEVFLQQNPIPTTSVVDTFNYVIENNKPKLFFNYEQELQEKKLKLEREAQRKEIKEKVELLYQEAALLEKQKKLKGALAKYDEILELDSSEVKASIFRKEAEKEIKSFAEKNKYIHNVELYDLEARYITTYIDEKKPGVRFKIKNSGNRTLKEVKVVVYFKDKSDKVIAEEDYYPVLVSEYSFGSDNKPLKPNYIWQLEDNKYYTPTVPDEWEEGNTTAKVVDIEFE